MFSLKGKTALITGSGRGLGLAIGKSLASQGANIILSDLNQEILDAATQELSKEFPQVQVKNIVLDVGNDENVKEGMQRVDAMGLGLHVVVNNAGINMLSPVVDTDDALWERMLSINVLGVVRVSRAAHPLLKKQGGGKIINLCSIMAELARPTNSPYATTKGAVRQLTRGLAIEWAPDNIQVNGIAPGFIATDMITPLKENPELNDYIMRRTPAKRWGTPEEVGAVAAFLAASATDFLTGQMICMDGGFTISS